MKDKACPRCGVVGQLDILVKLVANPIGSFDVEAAGAQMKVTAKKRPILVCNACDMKRIGRFDVEGKYAVFEAE